MSDFALPGANAFLDGTGLPATLYVQLHTGNPSSNGTSNVATETTRKSFTRGAASGGTAENAGKVTWTGYPTVETITHISVWSASSGGTCWFVDDIGNITPGSGETVEIDIGGLDLTITVWS